MKKILLLVFGALAIGGCSGCNQSGFVQYEKIQRQGVIFKQRMESAPVTYRGKVHYVVSSRVPGQPQQIEIYDDQYKLVAALPPGDRFFVSAIVVDDKIVIIGTYALNSIQKTEYKDGVFSPWQTMFDSPSADVKFYNTSVTKTDTGYVMAYETCEVDTVCFNVRFKTSTDLVTWTDVGDIYSPQKYAACPIIRKFGEYYYMYYLGFIYTPALVLTFQTYIVRSKDLINWSEKQLVISPTKEEGINASDLDMTELNGKTYIVYADGDQKSDDVNVRLGIYNGTQQELAESYFTEGL